MSFFIPSLDEAGKKISDQIFVELVKGIGKQEISRPPMSVKKEPVNKIKPLFKETKPPVVDKKPVFEKEAVPVKREKPRLASVEPVDMKEELEKVAPLSESSPVEEDKGIALNHLGNSGEEALTNLEKSWSNTHLTEKSEDSLNISEANYSLILEMIEAVKIYPKVARKRGLEGTAIISFRIDPDGDVADITIERASGFSILDRAAIKSIKRAAPFPHYDSMLKVEVTFRLT